MDFNEILFFRLPVKLFKSTEEREKEGSRIILETERPVSET